MNLWKILKASKGLPTDDCMAMLFARKIRENSTENATVSGVPCILENSAGKPVVSYNIYGNSVQSDTPTPKNPVEVQSVGELVTEGENSGKYEIPVVCRGKNLLNIKNLTTTGYIASSGNINMQTNWFSSTNYERIPRQTATITISADNDLGSGAHIAFYDLYKNLLSVVNQGKAYQKTFNVPKGTIYFKTSVRENNFLSYMVELGDTATEYEAYREPVRTSIFLDEPLRKIGDYVDYIDFENGRIVRNIGKKVFGGSERISLHYSFASHSTFRFPVQSVVPPKSTVLSTHAENVAFPELYNNGKYGICSHNTSTVSNLYIAIPDIKELDEMKSFLKEQHEKGNPVTVYYPLAEPIEETAILPEIPTFSGTTIIETDTEIQPSDMKITYKSRRKNNG